MTEEKQKEIIRQIAKHVSDYFGLTIFELVTKTRLRKIVSKRQIEQELCYSLIPDINHTIIGIELGNQDHSTVIHSIEVVRNLCESDKKYREDYENLHRTLSINLFPAKQRKDVLDRLINSKRLKYARSASKRHKISYDLTYSF